jgi:hypothetical protein
VSPVFTRKRLLIRGVAIFLVVAGLIVALKWPRASPSRSFRDLTEHVLRHGRTYSIPAEALANLKLPTDGQRDVPFRAALVEINGPAHTKTFAVRFREGTKDVLMSDAYTARGRFFHCTEDGTLISASTIRERLTREQVRAAFDADVRFWIDWWERQAR